MKPQQDVRRPASLASVARFTSSALTLFALFAFDLAESAFAATDYPIAPVPFTAVRVADAFWSPRMETNRVATVPACFKKCEETGRIDNFAKAGKLMPGAFRGIPFDDSDVFKVIEGASYTLALHRDPALEKYLDDLIAKIAAAQEPDGYLYTSRTIEARARADFHGAERWSKLVQSHELYNVGHMYEAAVAHFQATGKRTLLDVAIKNANLLVNTFAPDKRHDPPGHEETEIGLVKLYRATGEKKYLDLAKFFIDCRGRPEGRKALYGEYAQDHKPVTEQDEPIGHAVRAGYLYSGMADVAAITGNQDYTRALDKIWTRLVSTKIYLTGGIGAEAGHEGFGPDYHLPNQSAYNETCAAIALALWNHRMFLLHGDAQYLDVLERVLYNGFLSGVAFSGDRYFYPNPLACDGQRKFNMGARERSPWFDCACCPVNIVRFVPSIAGYIYAQRDDAAYVNLFVGGAGTLRVKGQTVKLTQETRYPWDGRVKITVAPERTAEFAIKVRIPGWVLGEVVPSDLYRYADPLPGKITLKVNGKSVGLKVDKGFARVERTWKNGDVIEFDLPMAPRRVLANEKVKEDAGRVALERGPIVYCVEAVDHGGSVTQLALPDAAKFTPEFRADLLGGVTVLRGEALAKRSDGTNKKVALTAVPYYAWNHRGPGEMAVWLPWADASAK
ncbi:MAG: glycoside hydrolase family 127 protein [Verrucomicrobia bacterium]|nr:glycoside hydrolase family 127 protein [Verrucomicrobiota bacterium]